MANRLYSTEQVATLLGCTEDEVAVWIRRGLLDTRRLDDGSQRVPEGGLVRFLREQGIDLEDVLAKAVLNEGAQDVVDDHGSGEGEVSETRLESPQQIDALTAETVEDDDTEEDVIEEQGAVVEAEMAEDPADGIDESRAEATVPGDAKRDVAAQIAGAILDDALASGASHIHIEPWDGSLRLRFRICGSLVDRPKFAERLPDGVVSSLVETFLKMADNRARITYRDAGRFETFLSTVFHTQAGPALTLAAAPESPSRPAAAGFDVDARRWLARMAGSRNGLLLLADRSAKSRATILDAMAGEWLAANRRMLAVDARRALKLPDAMRLVPRGEWADTIAAASARQADIDVLCIDEITDAQMMDAASAAAADCMVVAGVGAEDGREAMDLLMSLQPQPWSIASSLTGVAVVRAVRKLCAHCHTTAAHDREWVDRLRLSPETIGDTSPAAGGCEHCAHTGFDGLTLVGPAIETNVDLRELLRSGDRGEILREFDRLAGPDAVAGAMTAGIRNDRTTLAELARAFG